MNVAAIGGGAMGGFFASRLSHAGVEVTVVDTSSEVLEAIKNAGLRLSEGGGEATEKMAVAEEVPTADLDMAIVFVKAHHTAAVATALGGRLRARSTVVSLQNGWGNADVLASTVPAEQLVIGVTYHSCTLTAPGIVAHTGSGPTFVGPYRQGGSIDRSEEVARVLGSAGIEATATADIRTEIWKKLVLNAATLPVAALSRQAAGEIHDDSGLLGLSDALVGEAVAVAGELGIELSLAECTGRVHRVLENAGRGKPSMLQDVEARRKTEVETISGAVVRAAEDLGIDVPLNRAMVALVHGLERSWSR